MQKITSTHCAEGGTVRVLLLTLPLTVAFDHATQSTFAPPICKQDLLNMTLHSTIFDAMILHLSHLSHKQINATVSSQ